MYRSTICKLYGCFQASCACSVYCWPDSTAVLIMLKQCLRQLAHILKASEMVMTSVHCHYVFFLLVYCCINAKHCKQCLQMSTSTSWFTTLVVETVYPLIFLIGTGNFIAEIISSYHIVDLKRQNRLKVGTNQPKLKVKMQSVSDDDARKRLLEQTRFELAAKGVFRLGRCYIFWQSIPGLQASNWESTATDGWSLDRWHQKTIGPRNASCVCPLLKSMSFSVL